MHKTEDILIFEKIQNFRQLLKEYVSRTDLVDAINNNEVIKIRYEGADTDATGWRTVEPFVLGTHADSGNMVLRGWQQAGSSESMYKRGRMNFPKGGNDKYQIYDVNGVGPGWRMFRVDGIKEIKFTDKRFDPQEAQRTAGYKSGDSDMISIVAAATPSDQPTIKAAGKDIPVKTDASVFDKQTQNFRMDTANQEAVLKNAILNANRHIAGRDVGSQREKLANWFLVTRPDGKYDWLRDNPTNRNNYKDRIVGNLQDLKDKHFGSTRADFMKNKRDFINKINQSQQNLQ